MRSSARACRRGRANAAPPRTAALPLTPHLLPTPRAQPSPPPPPNPQPPNNNQNKQSNKQPNTEKKAPFDELVEQKGVRVLIDPAALMHVLGTRMDWQEDRLRSEFVFINPNSKGSCGCGESFTT